MARTFSKRASAFIDANAKTKTTVDIAEMAVNMAVNDVMSIVETTLIEYCPHQEVCSMRYSKGGCQCSYLDKYMGTIKGDGNLCFKKLDKE